MNNNLVAAGILARARKARSNKKRYELAKQAITVLNMSGNIDDEGTKLANEARAMFHKNWKNLVDAEEC